MLSGWFFWTQCIVDSHWCNWNARLFWDDMYTATLPEFIKYWSADLTVFQAAGAVFYLQANTLTEASVSLLFGNQSQQTARQLSRLHSVCRCTSLSSPSLHLPFAGTHQLVTIFLTETCLQQTNISLQLVVHIINAHRPTNNSYISSMLLTIKVWKLALRRKHIGPANNTTSALILAGNTWYSVWQRTFS